MDWRIEAQAAAQRRAEQDYWAWHYAQGRAPMQRTQTPSQETLDQFNEQRRRAAELHERAQRQREEHAALVLARERAAPDRRRTSAEREGLIRRMDAPPQPISLLGSAFAWFVLITVTYYVAPLVIDQATLERNDGELYVWLYVGWAILFLGRYCLRSYQVRAHRRLRPVWSERVRQLQLLHGCGAEGCRECYA